MNHRFSTWWRALSVVLLSLATVTWPSAAQAGTTSTFNLVHQDAVTTLSKTGTARFGVTMKLLTPNPKATVEISLFPRISMRSQITPILSGAGSPSPSVATTGNFTLDCQSQRSITFTMGLYTTRPGMHSSLCDNRLPLLHLPCDATQCDGVYPLSYSLTSSGLTTTKWSLIAVQASRVSNPLRVDWIETIDPSSPRGTSRTTGVLQALAHYPSTPLTLSADYRTLNRAQLNTSATGTSWLAALKKALASPLHLAIASPPRNIDFGGLAANGLPTQVAQQLSLSNQLLHSLTGRYVDSPVLLTSTPSTSSLAALSSAGVHDIVLRESALSVAPSLTLNWGAPFHPTGSTTLSALSGDGPLSQLATDTAIEPGRRAALTMAILAFLHFEAPNASASRSVVITTSAANTSATFVADLLNALPNNPFVIASNLDSSFNSSLIGTNGAPATRSLVDTPPSTWSAHNVSSLSTLIGAVTSFSQAVSSPSVSNALHVAVAQAEISGGPNSRQTALNAASEALSNQVHKFTIDPSTITLAGPGTALPITLFSRAHYTVTAVVHLITNSLLFPKGKNIVVTLGSPTQEVRVPIVNRGGGSLTLQVLVTTPNGQVVLSRAAIQVRSTGTSVVGYLLTLGSLLVLAFWWWRTYRRGSKGRHAR